jgi:hypothetical protein
MEQRDENKQRMLTVVWNVLIKYIAVWSANLGFKGLVDELKECIDAIDAIYPEAEVDTTGMTADKGNLKKEVIHSIMEVAGPLATTLNRAGNMEVKKKVTFTDSDLASLHETDLAEKAIEVSALGTTHLDDAKKYGLEEADVKHLSEVGKAYSAMVPKRRAAISGRMSSKESRGEILQACLHMLKVDMDSAMEKYRRKNVKFYNEYFNARNTENLGIRHEKPPTPSTGVKTQEIKKEEGK